MSGERFPKDKNAWVVLGLSEDDIWEALEEAFTKKHGAAPDRSSVELHGAKEDTTARESSSLLYTARVLRKTYEKAMLDKLAPPVVEESDQ